MEPLRSVKCIEVDASHELPVGTSRSTYAHKLLASQNLGPHIRGYKAGFTLECSFSQVQKVKGEGKKRVVAVLPPGDDDSPEVLNSVKRGLGLREWLEGMGHEYIVTAEKDPGTGESGAT